MQKIYASYDLIILYLLKSKLEEKNIHCLLKNETPPLAGELPPLLAQPELWIIQDHDAQLATAIVEETIANLETKKPAWQCQTCKETVEGEFDICWKCNTSK